MSVKGINNFPESTRILLLDKPFVLIDVGSRRGFHPVFNNFNLVQKIGFEPNEEECSLLNLNKSDESEHYFPVALGSKHEERKFYNSKNPGSSGLLPPNAKYWLRFAECESLDLVSEDIIRTDTLDSFLEKVNIKDCDFLKIDTEGFEQHIIDGGLQIIKKNALGVLCEVYFNPVREGGAKFGDIQNTLDDCGLNLFDITLSKIVRKTYFKDKKNKIRPDSAGQLVWGDAIFLRDPMRHTDSDHFQWDVDKYKKLISLYEIFNLNDCAYEIILHLEDKNLLSANEIVALKRLFLKKSIKNKFFNYLYNNFSTLLGILPHKVRKFLRKII